MRIHYAALVPAGFIASILGLSACGAAEQSDSDSQLAAIPGGTKKFCPQEARFDAKSELCVIGDEATGPFTPTMKQKCRQEGGGTACDNPRWSYTFARSIRGGATCPPGATSTAKGLCVEAGDAYGPFTRAHVDACISGGGGSVCESSLRWDAAFAEGIAPQPPINASLPWKWIMPTDNGLRSDSCGAGDFRASRGGGARIHKGIDILAPRGTNLLSPCQGTVRVGFERAGYGKYVVVRCRVPSSIVGRNSASVGLLYGHMDSVAVRNGQAVGPGTKVGTVGKTGNANSGCISPHVHFEVIVESASRRESGPMLRSLHASESIVEESNLEVLGTVSSLVSGLRSRCMSPLGFRASKGLSHGANIDPFVLLSCLAADKAPLKRAQLGSDWVPWSSYYSATGFDVNVGRR